MREEDSLFSILFLMIAAAEAVLLVKFVQSYRERRQLFDLIPTVLVALLVYENLVIGLGSVIGEGAALEALNVPRYVGHALLTPLLILWGLAVLRRSAVSWAMARGTVVSLSLLTAFLVGYGIHHDILELVLVPDSWADVLRYVNSNVPEGPPLTAILTGVVLIVVGGQLWIETRETALVWAAGIMASVAGLAGYVPVLGNAGELVLMAGILSATVVAPTAQRVGKAEVSRRAQQLGWITWPLFFAAAVFSFTPVWGEPVEGLPTSQEQYDLLNAVQGVWIVLMVLHSLYAIHVFGMARSGSLFRRFHVWFGYANLFLTFGGQMLFIFPATAWWGSRATELVFVTITVHVLIGLWFAAKRTRSRGSKGKNQRRTAVPV